MYMSLLRQTGNYKEGVIAMKIIKEGNLDFLKESKEFTCCKCGCIFEAEKDEYAYSGSHYNESYYVSTCPCCGTMVYSSDN